MPEPLQDENQTQHHKPVTVSFHTHFNLTLFLLLLLNIKTCAFFHIYFWLLSFILNCIIFGKYSFSCVFSVRIGTLVDFFFFDLCTFMSTNKNIKYLQNVTESKTLLSFWSFNSNTETTQRKIYGSGGGPIEFSLFNRSL